MNLKDSQLIIQNLFGKLDPLKKPKKVARSVLLNKSSLKIVHSGYELSQDDAKAFLFIVNKASRAEASKTSEQISVTLTRQDLMTSVAAASSSESIDLSLDRLNKLQSGHIEINRTIRDQKSRCRTNLLLDVDLDDDRLEDFVRVNISSEIMSTIGQAILAIDNKDR